MTSSEKILTQKFEKSRIVCWRDCNNELSDEFDALSLPGVEKIKVQNNEFSVLYRVLRGEPETKFLVFIPGEEPPWEENWLLDLEVTYDNFLADQASLWLGELSLGYEFCEITKKHQVFFTSSKKRDALKKLLTQHESNDSIRLKMLAVTVGSDCRIDAITEILMEEIASGKENKISDVVRYHLDDFLWQELKFRYAYQSDSPSIKDFVIRLFRSCYFMSLDTDCPETAKLNDEALVFLKHFKESIRHQDAYDKCSAMAAATMNLDIELSRHSLETICQLDFFKQIDARLLTELAAGVEAHTITPETCSDIVRARRTTFWYARLEHTYLAIDFASRFFSILNKTDVAIHSLIDGFHCYVSQYFRLDQLYRKFVYHASLSEQKDLLALLQEKIENFYSNNFLLPLSNRWQEKLDELSSWNLPGIPAQTTFYDRQIKPFLENNKKVFVIISDALRYEVAEELCQQLIQEDRYEPALEAAYSTLPSFTALGMAALLPHRDLTIKQAGKGIAVFADEQGTQGSDARAKVLSQACASSSVLSADEFSALTKENGRAFFRDNDVAYIYHNCIDKTGDDKMTETHTCEAAETAITELILMIKKLTAFNATNIIVTSDHGFIFQNRELAADDYLHDDPAGNSLWKTNRRFVIGCGLESLDGMKSFSLQSLGLHGDCEIQVAKGMNRLRVSGAGSRYVHGGATLQEIVIPILKIRKKRSGDVACVDVDIISGMTVITSGQLAITCYQQAPVGGKMLPRKLTAALFSLSGELISNEQELNFDLTAAEPRDRQVICSLVLTHEAEKFNGQEVLLKLREHEVGTTFFKDYQTRRYQLRRQLMDLDF